MEIAILGILAALLGAMVGMMLYWVRSGMYPALPSTTITPGVSSQDLETIRQRVDVLQAILGSGLQKTADALSKVVDAVNELGGDVATLSELYEAVSQSLEEFKEESRKDFLRKGDIQ